MPNRFSSDSAPTRKTDTAHHPPLPAQINPFPWGPHRPGRLGISLAVVLFAAPALAATAQSAPWADGEDGETERFLLEAEIVEVSELGTGVTRPKRLTLRLGDRTGGAVWKNVDEEATRPASGSFRPDDTYFRDKWQHEVAAYRVDRLIGLRMVPVTVVREVDGEIGSLQLWIEGAFTERDRVEKGIALLDPGHYSQDVVRMRAFDSLIYNVDRSQENILFREPGSRLWLIDHSRAFRLQRNLPPVKRKHRFEIEPRLYEVIAAPSEASIRRALDGLLTEGQIKGLLARRARLERLVTP